MLYNLASLCLSASFLVLITQTLVAHNSLEFCYALSLVILLTSLVTRVCRTCILCHVVYVMHCSLKLLRVTPDICTDIIWVINLVQLC